MYRGRDNMKTIEERLPIIDTSIPLVTVTSAPIAGAPLEIHSASESKHQAGETLTAEPLQPLNSASNADTGASLADMNPTPTRISRSTEPQLHVKNISRSSSVPSKIHLAAGQIKAPLSARSAVNNIPTPTSSRNSSSSVKHLTCFWWKEKGFCRFSDDNCLYAHYDTGHYTEPPRQIIPGEPALAGRKLDRAMRSLAIAHRSSASLSSMAGSRHNSRPGTPVCDFSSPLSSPLVPSTDPDLARLNSDNQFLRSLVDQSSKEKAIMISTIENLQADHKAMKEECEKTRKINEDLLDERDALAAHVLKLEQQSMPLRSVSHPYGAIGRARVNTETKYLGGLLQDE